MFKVTSTVKGGFGDRILGLFSYLKEGRRKEWDLGVMDEEG